MEWNFLQCNPKKQATPNASSRLARIVAHSKLTNTICTQIYFWGSGLWLDNKASSCFLFSRVEPAHTYHGKIVQSLFIVVLSNYSHYHLVEVQVLVFNSVRVQSYRLQRLKTFYLHTGNPRLADAGAILAALLSSNKLIWKDNHSPCHATPHHSIITCSIWAGLFFVFAYRLNNIFSPLHYIALLCCAISWCELIREQRTWKHDDARHGTCGLACLLLACLPEWLFLYVQILSFCIYSLFVFPVSRDSLTPTSISTTLLVVVYHISS